MDFVMATSRYLFWGVEVSATQFLVYHKVKFRLWNHLGRPTLDPDEWMDWFLNLMVSHKPKVEACWKWFVRIVKVEASAKLTKP